MAYVDKEKFKRKLQYIFKTYRMSEIITEKVKKALDDTTVDVVEVVRCKDCKHRDDCGEQMVHTTRDYVLEQNVSTYNKVDFCSYGEREEE